MLNPELVTEMEAGGVRPRTIQGLQFMADSMTTKETLREQVRTGQITADNVVGYGDVAHKELCEWLGVPPPEPSPQTRWYVDSPLCPNCGMELNVKKQDGV